MNTYILNRAILNRDALDDNQRKAMFARLGGHGGGTAHGASASKARDAAFKDKMAKAWNMGLGLGKDMIGGIAVAEARGVQAAAKSPLLAKFRDALRSIAEDAPDVRATQQVGSTFPGNELAASKLRAPRGVDPSDWAWAHSAPAGGGMDPMASAVQGARDRAAQQLHALRAKFSPAEHARRNELAAALRRDRELKRLDQHPELFRPSISPQEARLREAVSRNPHAPAAEFGYMGGGTIGERMARIDREAKAYRAAKTTARGQRPGETLALFGNRLPPPRNDEERRRRAYFARIKGLGRGVDWREDRDYGSQAARLLRQGSDLATRALAGTVPVVIGPDDRNRQPENGFLDWALREQRPGGEIIQPNPRNPYDTPEQWAQHLRAQYEQWLQQNPGYTLPVSRPAELPVSGSRRTVQEIPVPAPNPTPPRQRPTPPSGPGMPIGGPAPVYGEPGTRPIDRIGGPAPVRRTSNQPISTPKATASAVQRAVGQFRTW